MQFYQTRSYAVVLYNTLLEACVEKAVCMKTQEELYQKVRLTLRVPRVVLKSNSQYGQQDRQSQDARSSWEQAIRKVTGETCRKTMDYRIAGLPLSAVEQQNKHQHKESFLQDLSQTQKINSFSKESQDLIADMSNTEIFELCHTSSKQQCSDCITCWLLVIGIIYCSSGRNMKSSRSPTEFEHDNHDVTSILGNVIKKGSRGSKHGPF